MYEHHIVLDFEMNPTDGNAIGLNSEIIEIGAVKLDRELRVVDRFRCYVKPRYSYQVTPYISRLTGIHPTKAMSAESFELSIEKLSEWIGASKGVRIYSWSDTDLRQLRDECRYKGVPFPANMRRWLDLQKVFPRFMKISDDRRRIALKEAARYADITVDSGKAHDALYDSEITAELLIFILSGRYREQLDCLSRYTQSDGGSSSLGDVCGGVLADLLRQLSPD